MNTTITTDHPLVGPEVEVWGARLTSYFSAMGMVILQYDCLLTLKDEVCLTLSRLGPSPHSCSCRCALFGQGTSPSQRPSTTSIDTSLSLL